MANDTPINTPGSPTEKVVSRDIGADGGGLRRKAQAVDAAPWPRLAVAATLVNSKLTVTSGAAVLLSTFAPSGATHAEIEVSGNIRWWDDGKTPTASNGKRLYATVTSPTYYWSESLSTFSMIAETGSVEVNVSWYRYFLAV